MGYSPTAAALGIDGPADRRRVIVRGGNRSKGDCLQFDLAQTDAATTNANVADPASSLVNVVTPATAMLAYGCFGMLLESTLDDQKGYVCIEGFCDAYCIKASGDINPGDPLVVDTNGNLSADGTLGYKIVAYYAPLDGSAMSAPSTRTIGRVYFSGVNPIGAHGG